MALDAWWPLLLLPLAVLPLLRSGQDRLVYPWLPLLPSDPLSRISDWLIRGLASAAMLALILALAGPHLPEEIEPTTVEAVQVMLVVDRSRSMGDDFEQGSPYRRYEKAREMMHEIVSRRPDNLYGVIGFSTAPLRAIRPTGNTDAVRAAIDAATDRGLTLTEVAAPLVQALDSFHGHAGASERVILLVSDGELGVDGQHAVRLRLWSRDAGVRLHWLRFPSPSDDVVGRPSGWQTREAEGIHFPTVMGSLEVPTREVWANEEDAVDQVLAGLDALETGPVPMQQVSPRRELDRPLYIAAGLLLFALVGLRSMELER
nr:vWA domain-containing protein [Methylonatrum kenyense]